MNLVVLPGSNMKWNYDERKIVKIQKLKAGEKISFFNFKK